MIHLKFTCSVLRGHEGRGWPSFVLRHQWFPVFICYKWCCYEHFCTYLVMPACANTSEWKHWAIRICMSSFIRFCPIVFQSGCTNLYSLWRCTWVLVTSHPHQHLVVCSFCHSYGGCSGISLQFRFAFPQWFMKSSSFACVYWMLGYLLL